MHLSKHTQWAPPQNCWFARSWVWLGSLRFKQNLTLIQETHLENCSFLEKEGRGGGHPPSSDSFLSLESPIFYTFVEIIADFSPQAHVDVQSYPRERMHTLVHQLFYFKKLFSYYCGIFV